jgi:hypothetical protein
VARGNRKPGRITIGSRAVAVAIVAEAIDQACTAAGVGESELYAYSAQVAEELVGMAWDVEYKPTAERLVIILDAGITSSDKMRSTPEDVPDARIEDTPQCPNISSGVQCTRDAGHDGPHSFDR